MWACSIPSVTSVHLTSALRVSDPDWWLNITEYVAYPKLLPLPLKSQALCEAPSNAGPGPGKSSVVTLSMAQVYTIAAAVGMLLLLAIVCTAMFCRHERLVLMEEERKCESGTIQEGLLHKQNTEAEAAARWPSIKGAGALV